MMVEIPTQDDPRDAILAPIEREKIVRIANQVYQTLAAEYKDPRELGRVAVILGQVVGMVESQAADRPEFRKMVIRNADVFVARRLT